MSRRIRDFTPFVIGRGKKTVSIEATLRRCLIYVGYKDPRWALKQVALDGRLGMLSLGNGKRQDLGYCLGVLGTDVSPSGYVMRGRPVGEVLDNGLFIPLEWVSFECLMALKGEGRGVPIEQSFPGAWVWEAWASGSEERIVSFGRQSITPSRFRNGSLNGGGETDTLLYRWLPLERKLRIFGLDLSNGEARLRDLERIEVADDQVSTRTVAVPREKSGDNSHIGAKPIRLKDVSAAFAKELQIHAPRSTFNFFGMQFGFGNPPEERILNEGTLRVFGYQGGIRAEWNNGKTGEERESKAWEVRAHPDGWFLDGKGRRVYWKGKPLKVRESVEGIPYFNFWELLRGLPHQGLWGRRPITPETFGELIGRMAKGEEVPKNDSRVYTTVDLQILSDLGRIEVFIPNGNKTSEKKVFASRRLTSLADDGKEVKAALSQEGDRIIVDFFRKKKGKTRHFLTAYYDQRKGLFYTEEENGTRRYTLLLEENTFPFDGLSFFMSGSARCQEGKTVNFIEVKLGDKGEEQIVGFFGALGTPASEKKLFEVRDLEGKVTGYRLEDYSPQNIDAINGITVTRNYEITGDHLVLYWQGKHKIPRAFFGDNFSAGDPILLRVEGRYLTAVARAEDWALTDPCCFQKVVRNADFEVVQTGSRSIFAGVMKGTLALEGFDSQVSRYHKDFIMVAAGGTEFMIEERTVPKRKYVSKKHSLVVDADHARILFIYENERFDGIMEDIAKTVIAAERKGYLEEVFSYLEQAKAMHQAGHSRMQVATFLFETEHPLLMEAFHKGVPGSTAFLQAKRSKAADFSREVADIRKRIFALQKNHRKQRGFDRDELDLIHHVYLAELQQIWKDLDALLQKQDLEFAADGHYARYRDAHKLEISILYNVLRHWSEELVVLGITQSFKERISQFLQSLARVRQQVSDRVDTIRQGKTVTEMSFEERRELSRAVQKLNELNNDIAAANKIIEGK